MTNKKLKESRLRMGLSQKAMAEALNTPYRTYQDWELGNRRIPGILDKTLYLLRRNMMFTQQSVSFDAEEQFFTGRCRGCGEFHRYYPDDFSPEMNIPDDAFDCCNE